MNSFIIKKAIVIYKASSFIFFALFFSLYDIGHAQSDSSTYCFDKMVNLKTVEQSIDFLLLPKDTIVLRKEDNCIDLFISADRGKLFEKYLSERYNLRREKREAVAEFSNNENLNCRLDFRTTTKKKSEVKTFKVGEKNTLIKNENDSRNMTSWELLLGPGLAGELEAGNTKLKVICTPFGNEEANLVFSYVDKNKSSVSSEFRLKKGEWLNVSSILKDLDEKNMALGLPQTEITNSAEKLETTYDLQLK